MTGVDEVVGRLLDARYRVGDLVAHGGMATVYEGVDTRLDRPVAVKVLDPVLARDQDFARRFENEARHVARLSHPNVVSVYDQGRDGDLLFLVMEYVPGTTLRQLLRDEGRLPVDRALDVTEQILQALGAAHSRGIVHRDIKPENVLVGHDGTIKVADFGLARALADTTRTSASGQILGTVSYLAPEQVERGEVDERTDLYATGVLLFELLTGSRPFTGDNPVQVAYQHVHNDVPAPSTLVPTLPSGVDDLVAQATRRDPDARFAHAGQFAGRLRRLRRQVADPDSEPTTVTDGRADVPTTTAELAVDAAGPPSGSDADHSTGRRRPHRRRRVLTAVLAIVIVLALATGGWWWFLGRYTQAPGLQAMTLEQAEAEAASRGLDVREAGQVYSEAIPRGQVDHADPGTGGRILRGGTIDLYLSKGPERHDVPALEGRTEDEARRLIEAARLVVGDVTSRYSETVAEGDVISTEPDPGTSLPPGRAVDLVVSKGRQPIDVPSLAGKEADKAIAALKKLHLKAKVTEDFSDDVQEGDVISQRPKDGTLYRGDTVRLVVSKGPDLVVVPYVKGQSESSATEELKEAGLKVSVQQSSYYFGAHLVIGQSLSSGTSVHRGSTVVITIV